MTNMTDSMIDMSKVDLNEVATERKVRKAARREFLVRLGSAGLGVAAGTIIAGKTSDGFFPNGVNYGNANLHSS